MNSNHGTSSMPRLHHIDSLRAYAILMMLQGHFIYTMLAAPFHQRDNFWYSLWMYGKGFTAPIFFTVTGLVLIYLILRKNDSAYQQYRIKKALKRGFYLILWGYLLRTSIYAIFRGKMNGEFWKVDVLHCIGIGMLLIVAFYYLGQFISKRGFQLLLLISGTILFLIEPITAGLNFDLLPLGIRNYFTRGYGSLFIPAPWVGYTLIGGFIGTLYIEFIQKKWFGISSMIYILVGAGILLSQFSSALFMFIYRNTDWILFKQIAWNNYLFIRLGHVLLFISLFIFLEKYLARLSWFNKIGQATLNIYIVHFFILYGSWFGLGISPFAAKTFTPFMAIIGAILFMVVTTYISLQIPAIKVYMRGNTTLLTERVKILWATKWPVWKATFLSKLKREVTESKTAVEKI